MKPGRPAFCVDRKKSLDFKLMDPVAVCHNVSADKEAYKMDKRYDLNDLSMMTGFTTRTLRNHIDKGLLKGTKDEGVWHFSDEDIDRYFNEPFVKEGLRIKYNSVVFDHLAASPSDKPTACVILDIPCNVIEANRISAFFCQKMKEAADVRFNFRHDKGIARLILAGDEKQVSWIIDAWHEERPED